MKKAIYVVAAIIVVGIVAVIATSGGIQKTTGRQMEFTERCIQFHPERSEECRGILDLQIPSGAQHVASELLFRVTVDGKVVFDLVVVPEPLVIFRIPVVLVVDDEYLEQSGNIENAEKSAQALLDEASNWYQGQFGVRFFVKEFRTWVSPELRPLPPNVGEWHGPGSFPSKLVDSFTPEKNEIIVLLTGADLGEKNRSKGIGLKIERYRTSDGYDGIAFHSASRMEPIKGGDRIERYVIAWAATEDAKGILIHEFAHIFGAQHVSDFGPAYGNLNFDSVMNPELFGFMIDTKNEETIKKNLAKYFLLQ